MDHYKQILDLTKEVGSLSAKFEGIVKSNKEINKKLDEALFQGEEFIRCQVEVNNKLWGDDKFHDKGEIPRLLLMHENTEKEIKLLKENTKKEIAILQEKDKKLNYFFYGLIPVLSLGLGKYSEPVINHLIKLFNFILII